MQITECQPRLESEAGVRLRAFEIRPFRKPRFDFIWHHHPEHELTYIIRGYGVRYVGNSILPFREGDLCLLGSHLPHAYGSHPKSPTAAEWVVLHFLPGSWGEGFWGLPENRAVRRLLDASARGVHFPEVSASVRKFLLQPGAPGMARFLRLLEELAALDRRQLLNAKIPDAPISDPRLNRVIDWVQQHSGDAVSQREAAALVRMSPAAFSRFFHTRTDRVFIRYVNEVRVARACAMLLSTDKSIVEIAGESGFNNLPNFNRRFREIVRMTPRDYRAGFAVTESGTPPAPARSLPARRRPPR